MSNRLLTAVLVLGSTTWSGAVFATSDSPTMPPNSYPPLGASPESGPLHKNKPGPDERGRNPFPMTAPVTAPPAASATKPASSNEDTPTATVLGKLHHGNEKEIEMGKMAEKAGRSKDVRNFGKQLVKDHTAADKKVVALAKEEKIDLAAAGSTSDHMPQPGPDFDLKFAQMMLEDHTNDVNMVSAARDTTADPKLKALLTELLPTLQKHKETAQRIIQAQTAHAEK